MRHLRIVVTVLAALVLQMLETRGEHGVPMRLGDGVALRDDVVSTVGGTVAMEQRFVDRVLMWMRRLSDVFSHRFMDPTASMFVKLKAGPQRRQGVFEHPLCNFPNVWSDIEGKCVSPHGSVSTMIEPGTMSTVHKTSTIFRTQVVTLPRSTLEPQTITFLPSSTSVVDMLTLTTTVEPTISPSIGEDLTDQTSSLSSISISTPTSSDPSSPTSNMPSTQSVSAPNSAGGLSSSAKMAIAVVCAILGTAALALGIFLLHRRKQRRSTQLHVQSAQGMSKAELHADSRVPVDLAARQATSHRDVDHVAGLHELPAGKESER